MTRYKEDYGKVPDVKKLKEYKPYKRAEDYIHSHMKAMLPLEKLSILEFAEKHIYLANQLQPGLYSSDFAPWQKEILHLFNNKGVKKVVLMSGSQIGKTQLLLNIASFYAVWEPFPVFLATSRDAEAKHLVKSNFQPLISASPILRDQYRPVRAPDGTGSEMLVPRFKTGSAIVVTGATTASKLSSRQARIVLCDEVGQFSLDVDGQGSALNLAYARAASFGRTGKYFVCSTPTNIDTCPIWAEYKSTDMRERRLPCPHCGHHQRLDIRNFKYKDADPYFVCIQCQGHMKQSDRHWMCKNGSWVPTNPDAAPGHIGFGYVSTFESPMASWKDLAREWELARSRGTSDMKTFYNTRMGTPFDPSLATDRSDIISNIKARRTDLSPLANVYAITMAVDTQGNRFEALKVGHGLNNQMYVLDHRVFHGNPAHPDDPAYLKLYNFFKEPVKRPDEYLIPTTLCFHDVGGGATHEVNKYIAKAVSLGVANYYPIVGRKINGTNMTQSIKGSSANKGGAQSLSKRTVIINSIMPKDVLYSRLNIDDPEAAGYIHFSDLISDEAIEQIFTEVYDAKAKKYEKVNEQHPNEFLDLMAYNIAAASHCNIEETVQMAKEQYEDWLAYEEPEEEEKDPLDAVLTP